MTDQTQVPEVNAAQLEEFFLSKQKYVKQLNDAYNIFLVAIEGIPALKSLLTLSMQHFYTGLITLEKAIAHVPMQIQPAVTASPSLQPEAKPEEPSANQADGA